MEKVKLLMVSCTPWRFLVFEKNRQVFFQSRTEVLDRITDLCHHRVSDKQLLL